MNADCELGYADEIDEPTTLIPEIYVDGFGKYSVINGLFRCTGYIFRESQFPGIPPSKAPRLDLLISLSGADQAQMETHRILRERPNKPVQIWRGHKTGH